MNLIFFGTSEYCLPILESLHKNFDLQLVVTRPDRPVGRNKICTPSPTKVWADEHKIPSITPETLKKDSSDRAQLKELMNSIKPDLAIVSDYGLIIPQEIFDLPKLGTLNIHFSKLPDLRGPSPVQFTLLRGDLRAWVTIFKLENPPELQIKMDAGPILWQSDFPIWLDDTTETLYTRLFEETALELRIAIKEWLDYGGAKLSVQDHSQASYCRFLTREDGFIHWDVLQRATSWDDEYARVRTTFTDLPKIQQEALLHGQKPTQEVLHTEYSPQLIYNFYRAVTPWPGMWTFAPSKKEGKMSERMKILKCHLENDKLVLDQIQFEGKTPQPYHN